MNTKWKETTLRKGTKTPKICRDMFITDSRGEYNLCEVKNGRMVSRELIGINTAMTLVKTHRLVKLASCFSNCFTYRTPKSAKLVSELVAG